MRRRTGRRGRKVVLEYSLSAAPLVVLLFPCFRIRSGGVFYVCGRVFVRCLIKGRGARQKKSMTSGC